MQLTRLKRISLRGFLLIVMTACVVLAVWSYRAKTQRLAVKAVEAVGGRVTYDWMTDVTGKTRQPQTHPAWQRVVNVVGQDFFHRIKGVTLYPDEHQSADEQVKLLDDLRHLEFIAIWPGGRGKTRGRTDEPGGLSDDGAQYLLERHRALKRVSLLSARLSDEMLKTLYDQLNSDTQIDRHPDFEPARR